METIHVKIGAGENINSRRNLLSSEINFLNISQKISNYNKLRALEFKAKTLLKSELKKLAEKMNNLKKKLPSIKDKKFDYSYTYPIGKETSILLEKELKSIKDELEKLN